MAATILTISSKNYSSWSLRAWLLVKHSRLEFSEELVPPDPPDLRSELLLLKDCRVVPCLHYDGIKVWDTMAIAEFLNELNPGAGLLPDDRYMRAHCRSISYEMNGGFSAMRAALPMNLKAHFPGYKIWTRARADIDRILTIWSDCLGKYGGPFLFGEQLTLADLMYAPVATRIQTYAVKIDAVGAAYCRQILALPPLQEWIAAAKLEPEAEQMLEAEF